MKIWLSIILATLFSQIPNIWAIKLFNENPTFKQALYVSLLCLPFSFIATACFSYYYGTAFKTISYPVIAITAYGVSLISSILIQQIILKNKEIIVIDYIGILLVISGLLLIIFRTQITDYLK